MWVRELAEVGVMLKDIKGCVGKCWCGWRVVRMKVLSYNSRGLGGVEKRVELRHLIQDKHPFILCLQESKFGVINDVLIKSCWGDDPYGYSYQSSVGASGGFITVWDTSVVDVWYSMSFRHVLVIKGRVILTDQEFVIVNVYTPCDTAAKQILWDQLTSLLLVDSDASICVCGDFNSVRSSKERNGKGTVFWQSDADFFNKFIDVCLLIDLPICGRLFTWYRGNGMLMSRLD